MPADFLWPPCPTCARACQVFRLEELAEKLGFELTLDMLGDDDVAGTTQGAKQIRSAAAVLKNHARSYMKQARTAGMTLLQRLGTDAYYAFNCAVQDLTPKCMHWITVLGNVVLPAIRRTREEIRTGKIRQYKARMCLVAYEEVHWTMETACFLKFFVRFAFPRAPKAISYKGMA